MANEITPTQASALVPERWRPRFIGGLYEPNDITGRVLNTTEDFGGVGDIAHIATETFSWTVNDISSDGSLTVQQQSLTDVSVTVNKNKDITVEFTQITRDQAYKLWEESFPVSAAAAMRQQINSDILALYSDATTTAAGDGTGNLGEDELLAAIQAMVTAKLPILKAPGEFTFVFPDTQYGPLKKLNLLDYSKTGKAGEGGAASVGLPTVYEIPGSFNTQVASSGGIRYGLLFHRTALAWAVQRNVTPEMASRLAAAKLSWIMTVTALYGVKTVFGGRMVQLKAKA